MATLTTSVSQALHSIGLRDVHPNIKLDISWHSGPSITSDGVELEVKDTQHKPTVRFSGHDTHARYTLAMVDPDAPSRDDPKFKEFRHWTLINIPGSLTDHGTEISTYMGPAPPKGSGKEKQSILKCNTI